MSTAATTSVSSKIDYTTIEKPVDTKEEPKVTTASQVCAKTLKKEQKERPSKRTLNEPQQNVRPSKATRTCEQQTSAVKVKPKVRFKKAQPKKQTEFTLESKKTELVQRLTKWKKEFSESLNILEKNLHGATALTTMNTTQQKIQEATDVSALIRRLEYPKILLGQNKWLFSTAAQEKLTEADTMLTSELAELKKHK